MTHWRTAGMLIELPVAYLWGFLLLCRGYCCLYSAQRHLSHTWFWANLDNGRQRRSCGWLQGCMRLCNKTTLPTAGTSKWVNGRYQTRIPIKNQKNSRWILCWSLAVLYFCFYNVQYIQLVAGQESSWLFDRECNRYPIANSVSNLVCGSHHLRCYIFSILLCGLSWAVWYE